MIYSFFYFSLLLLPIFIVEFSNRNSAYKKYFFALSVIILIMAISFWSGVRVHTYWAGVPSFLFLADYLSIIAIWVFSIIHIIFKPRFEVRGVEFFLFSILSPVTSIVKIFNLLGEEGYNIIFLFTKGMIIAAAVFLLVMNISDALPNIFKLKNKAGR